MRPRRFLLSNPRALRFFVFALALLQFVAPTWHICEFGGHAAHRAATHHGAATVAALQPNQPLICFCAPHQKPLDPKTPRLDGIAPEKHATCLALLLQTMPGQTAAAPAIFESRALLETVFVRAAPQTPLLFAPRRFRGRAPPWKC